jgi:hypothetical protein
MTAVINKGKGNHKHICTFGKHGNQENTGNHAYQGHCENKVNTETT